MNEDIHLLLTVDIYPVSSILKKAILHMFV